MLYSFIAFLGLKMVNGKHILVIILIIGVEHD